MHPLTPSLSGLSDDELMNKVNELTSKLNAAARMGSFGMTDQLRMILDDYQHESQIRHQRLMDEMQKKSGDFKSIIDIQ
jgi:hypothetical protein